MIKTNEGVNMKTYTDGKLTIKVGTKYGHLYNKAGSKIGQADMRDGSYMKHMIAAGFKRVIGAPSREQTGAPRWGWDSK